MVRISSASAAVTCLKQASLAAAFFLMVGVRMALMDLAPYPSCCIRALMVAAKASANTIGFDGILCEKVSHRFGELEDETAWVDVKRLTNAI